jgi:hypothetical protein
MLVCFYACVHYPPLHGLQIIVVIVVVILQEQILISYLIHAFLIFEFLYLNFSRRDAARDTVRISRPRLRVEMVLPWLLLLSLL